MSKLKLFLEHPKEFNKLRLLNLSVIELSNISESTLPAILNNFDIVELATRLVPIRTVLGLTAYETDKKFSQTFFSPAPDLTEPKDSNAPIVQSKL